MSLFFYIPLARSNICIYVFYTNVFIFCHYKYGSSVRLSLEITLIFTCLYINIQGVIFNYGFYNRFIVCMIIVFFYFYNSRYSYDHRYFVSIIIGILFQSLMFRKRFHRFILSEKMFGIVAEVNIAEYENKSYT